MRYIGSKAKLAKYILPHLEQHFDECYVYVEPFVGGCNMMDKVTHRYRWGYDSNPHLIQMWHELRHGWTPPETIPEATYKAMREHIKDPIYPPSSLVGFAGFACSFSGDWFAGYSKDNGRNKAAETKRALMKQLPKIQDLYFGCKDYRDMGILRVCEGDGDKALIYCDPPYEGVRYYSQKDKFDSAAFWDWCLEQAAKGHIVYVSEYNAPEDSRIKCVWEQEVLTNAHQKRQKIAVERLYRVYA